MVVIVEWWKELGFKENPLDIKPNPNVLGLEEEEKKVINSLISGVPIHVYGEIGTGKTSLAKRIEIKLGKKYKIIYLNGEESKDPKIEEKIKLGFLERIFGKKKIIVLLDESQRFSEDFMRKVKYLFDEGRIYSFATFQIEKVLKNIPASMVDRFSMESVELKAPPEEIVKEIVRMRLENKVKIDERALEIIIRRNKRNVRGVLKTLLYIFSKVGAKKELTYEDIINNLPPTLASKKEEKIRLSNQQMLLAQSLLNGPRTIKDLEKELNIRKETIAKQLSRMLEKGYLIKRKDGKNVYYELKEDVKRALTKE